MVAAGDAVAGMDSRACREFDMFHVHFGFDALSRDQLQASWTHCVRRGKPLVYTVHDLRNPHHETPQAHDAHLDVLVPAADAPHHPDPGAAADDRAAVGPARRGGAAPAHRRVRPDAPPRPEPRGFVIGVHAKSLRASMAPIPVVRQLLPLREELPGARIVVDVHPDVFDEAGTRHDATLRRFLLEQANARDD